MEKLRVGSGPLFPEQSMELLCKYKSVNQWRFNGDIIDESGKRALTIRNIDANDNGEFLSQQADFNFNHPCFNHSLSLCFLHGVGKCRCIYSCANLSKLFQLPSCIIWTNVT